MFDHYIVASLAQEIQQELLGYRIQKVWARNHETYLLKVKGDAYLLLDLSPQKCHARIDNEKGEIQDQSFPFLLALRKTIEGAKLLSAKQIQHDRILCLEFLGRSVTLDPKVYRLYLEFMGRHGNAVLCDEDDKILYAFKQTPYEADNPHPIRGGYPYLPPQQSKPSPDFSDEDSSKLLNYRGFYKKLLHLLPEDIKELPIDEINQWIASQNSYTLYLDHQGQVYDLHQFTNSNYRHLVFSRLSELLAAYFGAEKSKGKTKSHFEKILANRHSLVREKINKLSLSLENTKKSEDYKRKGELLLAYLHSIQGSPKEVELVDYYEDKPVVIELDPTKSPLQNAQLFYKNYEKLQRSIPMIEEQLDKAKGEKRSLEQLLYSLEEIETPLELQEIIEEMATMGLLQAKKKKMHQTSKPRSFIYKEHLYQVGKNNQQNDELRQKAKNKNYLWFHAKHVPGSHVLLHLEQNQATKEALIFGAKLASYYSKAKGASIEVDYTRIQEVHKPKGAPPGFVIYRGESTVTVSADAEEILPYEKK